jgi:hypothetical protein
VTIGSTRCLAGDSAYRNYTSGALPKSATSSGGKWQVSNNGGGLPHWSRTGHELVYQSADQLMAVSYPVNGTTFIADKPRVWIASLSGASGIGWDLAADGKRVVALIPEAMPRPHRRSTDRDAPELRP